MTSSTLTTQTVLDESNFEQSLTTLYTVLLPLATSWVYAAHLYSWIGQENDIAWDIVLTTIQRIFEYYRKSECENTAIGSFKKLGIRIAKNYFHDLRRKDNRILPLNREEISNVEYMMHEETNSLEGIEECDEETWLFQEIAKQVVNFPNKLQRAMLIDISRRTDFDAQPTPLQEAFLKVGIQLEEYAGLMPQAPVLRSRHASLVSLGYRQLKMLFSYYRKGEFIAQALGA